MNVILFADIPTSVNKVDTNVWPYVSTSLLLSNID